MAKTKSKQLSNSDSLIPMAGEFNIKDVK